jgi:alpha-beta hydrolase superfamily lysophospholipase
LRIDVGDPAGLGETCSLAAWLFAPPIIDTAAAPPLVVMLPGGTYTKAYHHLVVRGRPGYSAAQYFARRGAVVVAADHLGTGESTRPRDGGRVTLEAMAAANASLVAILRERLARGELSADLPPLPNVFTVGCGHSLGGYLAQVQQADFGGYDAVAILGATCQAMRGVDDAGRGERELLPTDEAGYFLMPRRQNHQAFYHPDVPPDVIAADDQSLSALPSGMMGVGVPGRTTEHAGRITVPVFLAFGSVDLSPNPYREPEFYRSSSDVTLYLLPDAGHCHNSASTRHLLWRRLCDWCAALAAYSAANATGLKGQ